jgi:hypothetical protein
VFRDGWTVLGGFEYWFVNRFFGMEKVAKAMLFLGVSEEGIDLNDTHPSVCCLNIKV